MGNKSPQCNSFHSFRAMHSANLMQELGDLYDHLKESQQCRFGAFLQSKGSETDVLLLELLRETTGYDEDVTLKWMEWVARITMEQIWIYFEGAPYLHSLDQLSDQPSLSTLRNIILAKERYLEKYIWPLYDEENIMCSMLTCTSPTFLVMNGLHFCEDHRGLAFVYGFQPHFFYL